MYCSDEFTIDSSYVQPASDISGFHHQETNSSHASSSNSSHNTYYDYSACTLTAQQNPIPSFQTLVGGTDCYELYQPGSLTNLAHVYPGSNVVNTDLQTINYARNAGVTMNNSGDSNGQVHRGDETGQSKRKISEESETFAEDLENKEITKQDKSRVVGDGYLDINAINQLDYDVENVKWLQRPADFLTEAPLWRLLWKYGVQYLETIHLQRTDYVDRIRLLINTGKGKKQASDYIPLKDYQMISPGGRVWREKDICNEAKAHLDVDVETKKTACASSLCEKCVFKKHRVRPGKLFEHIYKLMGIRYRCLYCGLFFDSKERVLHHAESKRRKGSQRGAEPTECSAFHRWTAYKILPARIDFEKRFLEWTRILIQNIKKDNYLTSQSTEMLIEQVKSEIDFNFVDLFKAIEKIVPPSKRYTVETRNDDFYNIIYWNQNSFNTDPSKAAMFKIVEKNEKEVITIQNLENIRTLTISKPDVRVTPNTCVYKRCWCGGLFKAPDKKTLLQHVLTSNILIVCVGCNIGFIDFYYFEQHLTQPDCFKPISQNTESDTLLINLTTLDS